MENEAVIALCKCKESKKTYGIRFERISANLWKYTWAFPIKEDTARREGYTETAINGVIEPDPKYPGCPYCGRNNFILCSCGKLGCHIPSPGNMFTCDWCGMTGELTCVDSVSIKTGGDR